MDSIEVGTTVNIKRSDGESKKLLFFRFFFGFSCLFALASVLLPRRWSVGRAETIDFCTFLGHHFRQKSRCDPVDCGAATACISAAVGGNGQPVWVGEMCGGEAQLLRPVRQTNCTGVRPKHGSGNT